MIKPNHVNWFEGLVFIACSSMMVLVLSHYQFGSGDHIEQLPIVLKMIDANYLERDFFVVANSEFGPRYYYAKILSILIRFFGLPQTFFFLFSVSFALIISATYFIGYNLFGRSHIVGMLSVVFSLLLPQLITIGGNSSFLAAYNLKPVTMITPLIMLAIWAGIVGKPILAAAFSLLALPIHPLWAMEVGAVSIFASAWSNRTLKGKGVKFTKILLSISLLIFGYAIFFHGRMEQVIDTNDFVDIVARFRHPHHYIPSSWSPSAFLTTASFLWIVFLLWYLWSRNIKTTTASSIALITPFVVIPVTWIGGYIFVEVFPTRLWTTAQVFRLSILLNWLGLVILAGIATTYVIEYIYNGELRDKFRRMNYQQLKHHLPISIGVVIVTFIGTGFIVRQLYWQLNTIIAIKIFLSLALLGWLYMVRTRMVRLGLPIMVALAIFFLWSTKHSCMLPLFDRLVAAPQYTIKTDDVSDFVKANTNKNAVFITPPIFGRLRYTAERALVCDFKAFPFQDRAIVEWYTRIHECYGESPYKGFKAISDMDERYHNITDNKVKSLAEKYNATHAILYLDTPTDLETLFSNDKYKIVAIE